VENTPPIVKVWWQDSVRATDSWTDFKDTEDPEPSTVVSVGFLIKENKECFLLASHLGEGFPDDEILYTLVIPKVSIIKFINLDERTENTGTVEEV